MSEQNPSYPQQAAAEAVQLVEDYGASTELAAQFEASEAYVTSVGMREWAASTPDKPLLTTKGLAPCIGIAAYDPATKTGYVAHIAIPLFEQANITGLLDTIRQNSPDMNDVRVWVRGGQKKASMTADFDMPQMGRDSITAQLGELGLAEGNLDIGFDNTEMGSQGTSMYLNTETGEFKTTITISEEAAKLGSIAVQAD